MSQKCFSLFLMWDFQHSSRDLCCQKMCHSWQTRACGKYVVLSFKLIFPVSSQGFCPCAFSPLQTGKRWVTHRCGTRGAGLWRDKPAWSRHVFSTDRRTTLRWVTHFLIDCCKLRKHWVWRKQNGSPCSHRSRWHFFCDVCESCLRPKRIPILKRYLSLVGKK